MHRIELIWLVGKGIDCQVLFLPFDFVHTHETALFLGVQITHRVKFEELLKFHVPGAKLCRVLFCNESLLGNEDRMNGLLEEVSYKRTPVANERGVLCHSPLPLSLSLSLRSSPLRHLSRLPNKHLRQACHVGRGGEREGEEAPRSSFNFLAKNKFAWPELMVWLVIEEGQYLEKKKCPAGPNFPRQSP